MSRIINICGKPSCCPQIWVEDEQYKIFDKKEGWETGFMTKNQLKDLKKAIGKVLYNKC